MLRSRIFATAGGVCLFLAAGAALMSAGSEQAAQKSSQAAKAKAAAPAPGAGMRVFIDPATGQIREPEPAEAQQLAPPAGRTLLMATPPVRGAGGAVGMKLDDSQMVYSVATRNADGTISMECVKGAGEASKAVKGKPAERRQSDEK